MTSSSSVADLTETKEMFKHTSMSGADTHSAHREVELSTLRSFLWDVYRLESKHICSLTPGGGPGEDLRPGLQEAEGQPWLYHRQEDWAMP